MSDQRYFFWPHGHGVNTKEIKKMLEFNKSKMVTLMILLTIFISIHSFSIVPDLDYGLIITANQNISKGNQFVQVSIYNNFDIPVEIISIMTEDEKHGMFLNKQNGVILSTVDVGSSHLHLNMGRDYSRQVYPRILDAKNAITIDGKIDLTQDNGYYKEIILVKWRFPKKTYKIIDQKIFTYKIKNSRIKVVNEREYEENMSTFSCYRCFRDGKTVYARELEGYIDLEPYKKEKSDKSIVLDEAKVSRNGISDDRRIKLENDGIGRDVKFKNPLLKMKLNYCVRVRYIDNFINPPINTTGMKWWRPYGYDPDKGEKKTNFIGLIVELWDRDEDSADDYIKTSGLYYSEDGNYCCLDFEWDPEVQGEAYPDPYIKTYFQVYDPEFSDPQKRKGHLCLDGCLCNNRPVAVWRNSYYNNLGETETSTLASLQFGPRTSQINAKGMQAAAFQKFFRCWHSKYMTGDIYAKWVYEGATFSSGPNCIQISMYTDATHEYSMYRRWDVSVHEAGHSYHHQLLDTDDLYNTCPNPHYGYCSYNDHCATIEGWAEFVAMRSWYPSAKDISEPTYNTYYNQYPVEPGGTTFLDEKDPWHSSCNNYDCDIQEVSNGRCYSMVEIMVLRSFWDMWDTNPDGLADDADNEVYWQKLAQIWTLFPEGTGNGEKDESSPYFNLWDYWRNSSSDPDVSSNILEAMLNNATNQQLWD